MNSLSERRKKKSKYLKFYRESIDKNIMPVTGLCLWFWGDPLLSMFYPTLEERLACRMDISRIGMPRFWASGSDRPLKRRFTPMRQNIVLLMAAMNGEL